MSLPGDRTSSGLSPLTVLTIMESRVNTWAAKQHDRRVAREAKRLAHEQAKSERWVADPVRVARTVKGGPR